MTYFVTVDTNGAIKDVYSDENENVPEGAFKITDKEFDDLQKKTFGDFTHDGKILFPRVNREKIEAELIENARAKAIEDLIAPEVNRIKGLSDTELVIERGKKL